jgi:outer membrane protein assembly factor BamB
MTTLMKLRVRIQHTTGLWAIRAAAVLGLIMLTHGTTLSAGDSGEFNKKGHIVIADQFNNRVIEIDPETHKVVWQFGDESSFPGPHSIVGTNDAERYGELTLISGTGIPPASPALPGCPAALEATTGCPDNRVILVNEDGKIVWQYGQDGGASGTGFDQLNTPVAATVLPNGHFLITDQANERVIEVNRKKEIVWQYGITGMTGTGDNLLNNPNSAELLENGHILIADENNNRAIEVNRDHHIVRTFTAGGLANGVAFASRLRNGNILLTSSNNSMILEVDSDDDTVVWQYVTNAQTGSILADLPTRAVRLRNGNTLISDQFNNTVIEVNHKTPADIVFTQGMIGVLGNGFNLLNGPYDAKVIGDFTGLTPPPED